MNVRHILQALRLSAVMRFGVGGMAPEASAQGISVEIRSIAATKDGKSFDPKLNDLKSKLQGPFAAYTNFKQISTSSISIAGLRYGKGILILAIRIR